jgi:hypothetical protein
LGLTGVSEGVGNALRSAGCVGGVVLRGFFSFWRICHRVLRNKLVIVVVLGRITWGLFLRRLLRRIVLDFRETWSWLVIAWEHGVESIKRTNVLRSVLFKGTLLARRANTVRDSFLLFVVQANDRRTSTVSAE